MHCVAPRAGLDAYFSSGFAVLPSESLSSGWPVNNIDSGFRRIPSDVFAFEGAELLIFFNESLPSDRRIIIDYYPPGTTIFPITNSLERLTLRPEPGTLIRYTVDSDRLMPGGYIGVGMQQQRTTWIVSSQFDQQKMNFIIIGNPAGAAVNSQTVMLGDAFFVTGVNATDGVASVSVGDIAHAYDANVDPSSLTRINTRSVFTDGIIYRVNVDSATYAPYLPASLSYGRAFAAATPMYTASGVDDVQHVIIPGYLLKDDPDAPTDAPHTVTCNIVNPFGPDGPPVSRTYTRQIGNYPTPVTPWFTGKFVDVPVIGSNNLNATGRPAVLPAQAPPTVVHAQPNTYDLPAVNITMPDRLDPGPIMFERSTGAFHRIIVYIDPGVNATACTLTSMTSMQSYPMEDVEFPLRYYPKYKVFLESQIATDEPFRYNCQTATGNMSGTVLADQPAFIGLLANVTGGNDVFGWGGGTEFLGIGLVGFLGLMSCLVGYNRKNLAPAAVTFVVAIGLMGYFGILNVSESLLAALIVVVILAVFQRRQ